MSSPLVSRPNYPRKFLPQYWDAPLSRLIKSWSPVATHYRAASAATRSAAHLLSAWGDQTTDEAVSDVADKFGVLLVEMSILEELYSAEIDEVKLILKTIQDVESSIRPAKAHQSKLHDQINKASLKPELFRKVEQLQRELVRADAEVLVADAQLLNVTRERLHAAIRVQLDALQERCEKELVLVKYGRQLVEHLNGDFKVPGQEMPEYRGDSKTREIMDNVENALKRWRPSGWNDNENMLLESDNTLQDVSAATAAASASASASASTMVRY